VGGILGVLQNENALQDGLAVAGIRAEHSHALRPNVNALALSLPLTSFRMD